MKKRIRQYIRAGWVLFLLAAAVLTSGCVKRTIETPPVEKEEGRVEIALLWDGDTRPAAARLLFYDGTGNLVREAAGLTDGYQGTLPAGKYRLVVHNTDARQVDYRGTGRYETAEVFARQTDYSHGQHPADGVPCILEPQWVFGAGCCEEFKEVVIRKGETTQATVKPVLLTKQVQLRFSITGIDQVKAVAGVLKGVASSTFLATGSCNSASSCAVEFSAVPAAKAAIAAKTGTAATLAKVGPAAIVAKAGTVAKAATLDYAVGISAFDLLTTAQSPAGTNTMHITVTAGDDKTYTAQPDITGVLQEIIEGNEGMLPVDIPLDVEVEVNPVSAQLSVKVTPWDYSGTGSGEPKPR